MNTPTHIYLADKTTTVCKEKNKVVIGRRTFPIISQGKELYIYWQRKMTSCKVSALGGDEGYWVFPVKKEWGMPSAVRVCPDCVGMHLLASLE